MDFLNSSLDNAALEAQIREAKSKAATFSKSLQEAREQEAIALQALEEEREKWTNNYEKKTILIDQLERELTSTVEALDNERDRTKSVEALANNLHTSLEKERQAHDITRLSSPPRMTRAPEPRIPPVDLKSDNTDIKVWNDMLSQYNQQLRVTTDQLAAVSREKEIFQIQVNNLKKEREQSSLALQDVQGKLDFRMQQVLELEDEKLHFEKRTAALKMQIDTQYIQLSEANIKISTFQRDSAELTAVKEKNQTLERRIADMISEDHSARLRQELEEAKRIATSLQIQVKDLERTIDEWVRRTATAEEKLSAAQHRLIDQRHSNSTGGLIPAGPSDGHNGTREEWMHRAIVAEQRLDQVEKLGPLRHHEPAEVHSTRHTEHSHATASDHGHGHPHKNHHHAAAALTDDHTNDHHQHSSHHSTKTHDNHHSHQGHGHGHDHASHRESAANPSHHDHDKESEHHHSHPHHDGHGSARGSSHSREPSADNRHTEHSSVPALDNSGLSLSVVHGEASTVALHHNHHEPASSHHQHHSNHHHHSAVPQSAKSAATLGTVETVSIPSTLKTKSLSPHPPSGAAAAASAHHSHHLPPKHPFHSPAVVTYTSDVLFEESHEDLDADHQSEVSELSVLYGRPRTPQGEVVEHSQADYPSVTSDILGHAHDGKNHYEMRPKLRKQQKAGSAKSATPAGVAAPPVSAASVRRSTESLMSAKSAKSVGSVSKAAVVGAASKAATPVSGKKLTSASSATRNNEVTKFRQQDSNVVTVNPKMKDHPAVNTSAVSGTSAGFSVLDLVTPTAAATGDKKAATPSSSAKSGKAAGGISARKSVGNSGVKIISKATTSSGSVGGSVTAPKGETPRSASAPKPRPSSAPAATPSSSSSSKPPLPSQSSARKPGLPSRSSTPQGTRPTTPSTTDKKMLKVVMPTASRTS